LCRSFGVGVDVCECHCVLCFMVRGRIPNRPTGDNVVCVLWQGIVLL
jgi:hypothetical protein